MNGSDYRGRRAKRIGHEAVARVIVDTWSNTRAVVERKTAAGDLVGAGYHRWLDRRRSWPRSLVATSQLVALLSKLTTRSITVGKTNMKGGPTK